MTPMPQPFEDVTSDSDSLESSDNNILSIAFAQAEKQAQLEDLIDQGFAWNDGLALIDLRNRLSTIPEMVDRMIAKPHLLLDISLFQQEASFEGRSTNSSFSPVSDRSLSPFHTQENEFYEDDHQCGA